jgi:hypothetical protein
MPCIVIVLALLMPRVVVFLLWFFTHWFYGLRGMWLLLGFIFLPTTLLWYSAVQHWFQGQWTLWPIVGLVIALMIDVSPAKRSRRRD